MAPGSAQIWLITGASSGLGLALAEAVLMAGHMVIATARNPAEASASYPHIETLGGKWIKLDISMPDAEFTVAEAIRGSRIDVVVNNAAYSLLGCVEDMSEDEIFAQMNTNLYGPIRVIKAVLPAMRAHRSGTIVNISSIAALDGLPSCALYAASKAGLEAFSESLSHEVASFNIRVVIVEPGVLRTNFFANFVTPAKGLNPAYTGTSVDTTLSTMRGNQGKKGGDTKKAAQRIVEAITGTGMCEGKPDALRLPLGQDCYFRAMQKLDRLREDFETMKDVTFSTEWNE